MPYSPSDRRPIAARGSPLWNRVAEGLAARGVSPNHISVAGMWAAILGGAAAALTAFTENEWAARGAWLFAGAMMQARLLANLLDGMVAIAGRRASAVGELFNEVPDRVSDAAILIGIGYAAGGNAPLGYIAALLAVFAAYVRVQARVAGAPQDYCGPLAKPQRMFVTTCLAVWCGLAPKSLQPGCSDLGGIPAAVLLLIAVGTFITAIRRLLRAGMALRSAAAREAA